MAATGADSSSDLDSEFDEIMNDSEMNRFKERRMMELKMQLDKYQKMKENLHGVYTEAYNEKEVLNLTTTIDKVIRFEKLMQKLARKYFNTKFVRVNVEKAPFLVERLKIKVLPCMIGFIKGINVDRLVGFEDFGNSDEFKTVALEDRLFEFDMIEAKKEKSSYKPVNIYGYPDYESDDD